MKLRINALPDEAEDLITWFASHKKELRIVSCSEAYANTRNSKDETVRYYLEVRLTDEGRAALLPKGGAGNG